MNKFELQSPPPANAPVQAGQAPASPRPVVVVCEDEPALRELVRVSLGEHEYTFLEAVDGDEALALLREYEPDVLILDLMLPRRSGLEVLAELPAEPQAAGVGTVVLTAQPDYAERARELGA